MYKGQEIIDLPVINLETGKEIGNVKDVVFDPNQEAITGLIINGGSWLQGNRMVCYEKLHGIGEDAVTIEDDSALAEPDEIKECLNGADGNVIGAKVVTNDGKELGNIEDIVLNSNSGEIDSYEITDGVVQDILEGRGILNVSDDLKYGEDVVIVSDIKDYQRLNGEEEEDIEFLK